MTISSSYRGRFAPSPTGRLHFGSLVAALASYLDAKSNDGTWLVRMENLDPPREEVGADTSILRSLEAHHLYWDESVLYQSDRLSAYEDTLNQLTQHLFFCTCTRNRVIALNHRYDGKCRSVSNKPPNQSSAVRLRIDQLNQEALNKCEDFNDLLLGPQSFPLEKIGDFIIRRKDTLFAYQLAVAIDDHFQGITHIIRGFDLLDSTSRQRYILSLLDYALPKYGHTPLALGLDGDKLSKQTRAEPINNQKAFHNLWAALTFLGHPPQSDLAESDCDDLLKWAIQHWEINNVPKHSSIAPFLGSE
jgi:glutamyl-Q tRNA(Asp) synthetase